ncbi:hypothetical protein ACKLNR_008343 [Fusarium oxysporum f. sp. zingiberi]
MGQVYSVKHQATSEVNQRQDETTSSKRSVGLVQGRSIEPSPSKTAYDFHNKYRTWLGQVNAGICPSSISVGEYRVSGNKGSWQTADTEAGEAHRRTIITHGSPNGVLTIAFFLSRPGGEAWTVRKASIVMSVGTARGAPEWLH